MDSVRANRQLMALVSRKQQVQIIEADTSGLQAQIDSLTAQRDALQNRLIETQNEGNAVRASLAAVSDERDTALTERDGLSRRIEQLTQRTALFIDERDAAVRLSEERLTEILRLTEVMQSLNGELAETVAAFNEAEAARSSLALENQDLQQQIETGSAGNEALNAEVEALRAALDTALAERDEARADREHLLEELSRLDITVETVLAKNVTLQTRIDAALEQRDALAAEAETLRADLGQRDGQLAAANSTIDSMDEENRSLLTFVTTLEGDLNAREAALRESEGRLEEGQAAFLRLTAESEANQAFFDLVVGQCTALMGCEGGAEEEIDRQALAYGGAAAFESARRWRADLTEMVVLRDRSLRSCEARQAALEAQSCPQALGD